MKKIQTFLICILLSSGVGLFASNNTKDKTITISHSSSISKDLDGEWTIMSIRNKEINTRERACLFFNLKDSLFYGNNGCNTINGRIHSHGGNKISLDNIITTMMVCHNTTPERTVMKAINDIASYKITTENDIRHLTFMNSKGHNIMYLKNHDINFLNGAWTVSSINNEGVTAKDVRIVIDVQEMKIHGNSGCNIINGTLFIDPLKDWGVEFQELVSTRMMCPDIHIETALLVALEETQFCKKLNSEEIALLNGDGEQLATLKRLKLR